jgi:hypothetical protein
VVDRHCNKRRFRRHRSEGGDGESVDCFAHSYGHLTVTIVTPEGNLASAWRKSSELTLIRMPPPSPIWKDRQLDDLR